MTQHDSIYFTFRAPTAALEDLIEHPHDITETDVNGHHVILRWFQGELFDVEITRGDEQVLLVKTQFDEEGAIRLMKEHGLLPADV